MKAVVGKAEVFGCDTWGGDWVAVCDAHGTILNAERKKYLAGIDTEEFCDCCRENCQCFAIHGDKHFAETI